MRKSRCQVLSMLSMRHAPASELDILTHLKLPSTTIAVFDYAPDPVGNRDTLTETRPTFSITNGLNDFGYDLVNRLTSATHPTISTENYTYDPVGNRDPATWAYNAANQLLNDGTFSYTYDSNGNQLTKTTGAVTTTYTYSPENQLVQATLPGTTATYTYDGLGRRIQKEVNGVKTRYLYDQKDLLLEYDGTNALTARWMHGAGIDEPLLMERDVDSSGSFSSTERFTYHADGLGSITELTDSTGTVVRSYYYDAFGQLINQTGTLVNPYGFTAREYDPETGLSHYRARDLDHRTGRFGQEDDHPGFRLIPQSLNRYPYVLNNPVNKTDPFGLSPLNPPGFGISVTDFTPDFFVPDPKSIIGGSCADLSDDEPTDDDIFCAEQCQKKCVDFLIEGDMRGWRECMETCIALCKQRN